MSDKIFDTKNVILLKVSEDDLLSFLVDTDLLDSGEYDWRIDDLTEAIINVVPEYVFADYVGESVPVTKLVERLREAAKNIYKIKDYELMYRAYALHDEQAKQEVENSGFKRRGEFGKNSIMSLINFYEQNEYKLDSARCKMKACGLIYPQMKLLDMGFWQLGFELDQNKGIKKAH